MTKSYPWLRESFDCLQSRMPRLRSLINLDLTR